MLLHRVISRALICNARCSSTHFGFEKVPEEEKANRVHTVFVNVAEKYDLMNDAMSVGIHRLWKDYFVNQLDVRKDWRVVDVAGGTGDIAFRIARKMAATPGSKGDIVVCDINQKMLDVGQFRAEKDKTLPNKFSWVCGDAEKLQFEDNFFDLYTIAFGIRNVTHVDKALEEAYRVLKPGGRFFCLEFSKVHAPLRPFYDLYSFNVIPRMGQLLANDYDSYKYLVESIRMFPDQEKFSEMIRTAGFKDITYQNLSFGVCAIHSGRK
ncbi:unnamed protein product [Bursaphelenchus okinawaensis]|uniref:2-methoxy-6-polyprenyl-1,4-benzoquinol methylase, mitochondrial n=1 Tax=Bursaphelenchus okinawaensis TaxID=465554 RepID=A0A811KNF6_9BILA|nr:unnamed protein product [Bursaphelenchus okinawaensis]CAG9106706.1 unnamed protein product [Bursaphelenchus okinawaensis]